MKYAVGCAIAVIVVVFCLVVPVQADLVVNGGFDTGTDSWTPQNIDSAGGWRNAGGTHGGYFLLNDNGRYGINPTITQVLTGLQIGRTYTVTWDQYLHYNDSPGQIGFGVFVGSYPSNPVALNGYNGQSWRTFTATFTAFTASEILLFAAELDPWVPGVPTTTDMGYGIDNISVVASNVPLPGAVLLFAPGLAGLAVLRRRFTK